MDIGDLLHKVHHVASTSAEAAQQGTTTRFGIVSRTLHDHSDIKWILEGHFDGSPKSSLMFVGSAVVHCAVIDEKGRRKILASKADFPSKIQAAAVLKRTSVPIMHSPPQISKTQMCNQFISNQDRPSIQKDILVLSLASHEMMLLTTVSGQWWMRLSAFALSLPVGPSSPGLSPMAKAPVLIAIEPRSRAIALASRSGLLTIFAVGTGARHVALRDILHSGTAADAQMMIQHMAFLTPAAGDESRMFLLLIGTNANRPVAKTYSWSLHDPLQLENVSNNKLLVAQAGMPTLAIPLRKSSAGSFILICDVAAFLCTGAHLSMVEQSYKVVKQIDCTDPMTKTDGHFARSPAWVAYNDMQTSVEHNQERFWLAREDGLIACLEASSNPPMLAFHALFALPLQMSSAFCCMTQHQLSTIVAASPVGHGGIWHVSTTTLSGSSLNPDRK
ncbi:hypothetical protein MRB53_041648 [Persea americana]|nr:hypothetical protein MRB53_041648 [Persea americana]